MKKFLVLLFIVATFSGCAFMAERKADFDACVADEACHAQMVAYQKKTEKTSLPLLITASSVVPGAAGASIPVSKALGYLALGIAGIFGGHELRKKKALAPTV